MANEIKNLWGTLTDFATITNLNSLADGNWWQSGLVTNLSPSQQVIRISWELDFNTTPILGDHLWFKIAAGDGGGTEIWDAGIGTTESEVSTTANITAINEASMPQWTHFWNTNHGTTFYGTKLVTTPGPRWQLLISCRGEALAATGNVVRYQYMTPQNQGV